MVKKLVLGLSLSVLAGCASDPGPPHKVVFADPGRISFHFDPVRTDAETLGALARSHCDRYDREAQPIGVDAAESGLRQANFACVAGQ